MHVPIIDVTARALRRVTDQVMRKIARQSGADDRIAAAQAKRDRKNAKRSRIAASTKRSDRLDDQQLAMHRFSL